MNAHDQPVAIVTGAGSGIGREVCRMLGPAGFRVALVGRRESALRETIDLMDSGSHGDERKAVALSADLAEPSSAQQLAGRIMERWGRVDVLVNNAGMAELVPLDQVTWERLQSVFAANVFGPAMLIAALWPVFERQRGGCVVNVSSRSAIDPFPGLGIYGAAKAGLENLTRAIMNEGRSFRMRAFSVAPGAVETDMLRSMFSEDELPAEYTLDPADVAEVIVACIRGEREADIGRTISIPSPQG